MAAGCEATSFASTRQLHNRAPSAVAVAGHSSKKVGEYLAGKKPAKKAAAKKKKRAAKRKKA